MTHDGVTGAYILAGTTFCTITKIFNIELAIHILIYVCGANIYAVARGGTKFQIDFDPMILLFPPFDI
jgi:hypothetical protein